jgi:hypothetical protein
MESVGVTDVTISALPDVTGSQSLQRIVEARQVLAAAGYYIFPMTRYQEAMKLTTSTDIEHCPKMLQSGSLRTGVRCEEIWTKRYRARMCEQDA